MILPNPGGKVGHRRTHIRITPHNCVGGDSIFAVEFDQLRIALNCRPTWQIQCRKAYVVQDRQGGERPAPSRGGSAPRTVGATTRGPGARASRKPDGEATATARRARRFPPTSKPSSCRPKSAANSPLWIAATADVVARHLVAAGELLDEDPEAALAHARAARARSGRIAAVREAVGIAAYHCGDWAQALAELRAARRMGSKSPLLAADRRLRTRRRPPGTRDRTGAQPRGRPAHRRRRRRAAHRRGRRPLRSRTARAGPGDSVDPAAGSDPDRTDGRAAVLRLRRNAARARPQPKTLCSGSSTPRPPTSRASPTPKSGSRSSA